MSMCAFRNPIWVLDLFRYVKPYKKHSAGPDLRILKGFSRYTYIYSLRHFHIQGGTIPFFRILIVNFKFHETTLLFRIQKCGHTNALITVTNLRTHLSTECWQLHAQFLARYD